MKNLILLAAPGAGKGTLAKQLKEEYNYVHISTGDLLREIVASDDPLGVKIKEIQTQGALVSDDIVFEVLKKRLSRPDCKSGIILDGFPRNLKQAEKYEEIINELGIDLGIAILLDIDQEILKKRITGRRLCKECGEIYNIYISGMIPKVDGVCNKCGGELYQRHDDNEESLKVRYNTFLDQTAPLIDYYNNKSILYKVDAGGTPENTLNQVKKIIKEGE